jgi:hypothetical protein
VLGQATTTGATPDAIARSVAAVVHREQLTPSEFADAVRGLGRSDLEAFCGGFLLMTQATLRSRREIAEAKRGAALPAPTERVEVGVRRSRIETPDGTPFDKLLAGTLGVDQAAAAELLEGRRAC